MNNIRFIILVCILWIAGIVNAQQQVSGIEARNAAISTLRNKTEVLKVSSDENIKTVNSTRNARGDTIMYEVVFQNGAAVLLSGSKSCLPVLGYYAKKDNGDVFDPNNDNVPLGLKALLKDYADEIEWCFAQDSVELYHEVRWQELQQMTRGGAPPFVHVSPLLTTEWGQQWSNDSDCPAYNYYVTKTSANQCGSENCSNRCPVGCTGVAMGQIMKYWNYPVRQFDWCNMPDGLYSYSPNYVKERHAVARLLKDCADAANAVYCVAQCNTSATAIAARKALVNNFDYNSNAVFRLRSSHPSGNVWIDYLRTNLNAGRPILYGSLGFGDAHYWVCDGYGEDGNGNSVSHAYFHMNFGWRGGSDGWYTLNGLSGVGYYNISQEAVFNIYPNNNIDFCNYTYPLWLHYSLYSSLGFSIPAIHQTIPKAPVLESPPENHPASWRTIASGQSAEYVAHKRIILHPGFKVEVGGRFSARIEPCASCETLRSTLLFAQSGGTNEYNDFYGFEDAIMQDFLKNNLQDNEFNDFYSLNDSTMQKSSQNHLHVNEENQSKEISLYPNPNNGTFTININFDPQEVISILVFSPMGISVYQQAGLPSNTIQLPSSAKGLFWVEIITQNQKFIRKMVVN